MDRLDYQFWAAALGGGLAGAVLTQIAGYFKYLAMRPDLEIAFGEAEGGCVANTPVVLRSKEDDPGVHGRQRYLRIRLRNRGRSAAKNVNVCLTQIDLFPKSGQPKIFATEVLDLRFAMTQEVKFDIGSAAHRYVDIFGVAEVSGVVRPELGARAYPYALVEMFAPNGNWIAGNYSLVVYATADNAPSVRARLNWYFDGNLNETRILGRELRRSYFWR